MAQGLVARLKVYSQKLHRHRAYIYTTYVHIYVYTYAYPYKWPQIHTHMDTVSMTSKDTAREFTNLRLTVEYCR